MSYGSIGAQEGLLPQSSKNLPMFKVIASLAWGSVMWQFFNHRDTVQPSLRTSMVYLYEDSNRVTYVIANTDKYLELNSNDSGQAGIIGYGTMYNCFSLLFIQVRIDNLYCSLSQSGL